MAVIINFQKYVNSRKEKYVNSRKEKGEDVKVNKTSKEMCEIIYFNREDVSL